MNPRTTYIEVYLDSSRRSYGTNDHPYFVIDNYNLKEFVGMKVIKAVVPTSYYAINSANNTVTFQENVGVAVSFDITPGNYSKSQFEAEVKSKLEAASPNTRTYTVAISSITGLLTITVSAGTFALSASSLLGFNATSQATSQTSVNVINLTGPCCLQLRSSALGSAMSHVSNIVNQSQNNNVLATIPISASSFSFQVYQPQSDDYYDVEHTINSLDFYFTDDSERQISFNGVPIHITIALLMEKN